MMKIDTQELLKLLLANPKRTIEASLNDGTFNATHFLKYGGRKLFDCGIDSVDIVWNVKEFLAFYSKASWRIDQIV